MMGRGASLPVRPSLGAAFAATAIGELKEEAGVTIAETHCFAVCFLAERWRGNPRPDGEETTEIEFDPAHPLSPLHQPTDPALELLNAYLSSGQLQLR